MLWILLPEIVAYFYSIAKSGWKVKHVQSRGVCKVIAQLRLSLIVVRGLRAPQLLVD